jgi:hypothetical protein
MKELDLYEGFEEYDEYDFIAVDENNNVLYFIKAWEGFVDEIFREPDLSGKGWTGFTKLYQEGILDDSYTRNNPYIVENVTEFYNDLLNYKDVSLDNEAKELYDGLLELAKLCINSHCKIYLAIE